MVQFEYKPAKDLGMTLRERTLFLRREVGLIGTATHLMWWSVMHGYLRTYHRLSLRGREHVPTEPPFIMVANHVSHIDAMMMAAPLSWRWRDRIFPVAAGDVFFETPSIAVFAMACINALPMWRQNMGRHALRELRERLVEEPCIYILFPEGRRSRDGTMLPFKAGLGMLVAETDVPVVPCYLDGAFAALPPGAWVPRPRKLTLRIGAPLQFSDTPNRREGWQQVAEQAATAIEALRDPAS